MNFQNTIQLYPSEARIIDASGNNTAFLNGDSLNLYAYYGGLIYVNFLKTNIPSAATINDGKLYLHISNIGGTTSAAYKIRLDIYASTGTIDSTTTLSAARGLKGNNKIGTYSFVCNAVSDESVEVDIKGYLEDYIYGDTTAYGIIIEPKIDEMPGYAEYAGVYDSGSSNFVMFGGELNSNRNNNSVFVYGPSTNKINEIKTLDQTIPERRIDTYHTFYDDKMYVYGGYHTSGSATYYNSLWEFNLKSNTWREISIEDDSANGSPGYLRAGRMVVNADGLLYLIHGIDNNDVATSNIWKLDLTTSILRWELTTPTSTGAFSRSASYGFSIVHDERAGHEYDYYLIGGYPLATMGNEINKLELNGTPNWSNSASPNIASLPNRANSDAAFYNNSIYYFAGYGVDGTHNDMYGINPDTLSVDIINFEGTKPEARDDYRVFVDDTKFYVIGGNTTSKGADRCVDVWYTDLSASSNRRWVEAIDNNSTYSSNSNTIRISGISSYDSSKGERQGPLISTEYSYGTSKNIEVAKISPIITRNSYIALESPTSNFGTNNYVISQEANDESGVEKKALFYLDLSSIALNDDILSAILYIPRSSSSAQNGNAYPMELIAEDWLETQVTWYNRKTNNTWSTVGGTFEDDYNSYNLIIGSEMCRYDITCMLQKIKGSFSEVVGNYYGMVVHDQNMTFDSRQLSDTSYLIVTYIDNTSTQEVEDVILISPTKGDALTATPTFKFKVPYNASGGRLHFRLELSQDIAFSDSEITSFSTQTSQTGWYWESAGDDGGTYVAFPNNGIIGYTGDTSLVKLDMSETTGSLSTGTWYWRVFAIS